MVYCRIIETVNDNPQKVRKLVYKNYLKLQQKYNKPLNIVFGYFDRTSPFTKKDYTKVFWITDVPKHNLPNFKLALSLELYLNDYENIYK